MQLFWEQHEHVDGQDFIYEQKPFDEWRSNKDRWIVGSIISIHVILDRCKNFRRICLTSEDWWMRLNWRRYRREFNVSAKNKEFSQEFSLNDKIHTIEYRLFLISCIKNSFI